MGWQCALGRIVQKRGVCLVLFVVSECMFSQRPKLTQPTYPRCCNEWPNKELWPKSRGGGEGEATSGTRHNLGKAVLSAPQSDEFNNRDDVTEGLQQGGQGVRVSACICQYRVPCFTCTGV